MDKILILGSGGHARSLADVLEREKKYEIAGYVVNEEKEMANGEYPVIGNDHSLEKLFESGIKNAALGIGYLGKSNLRENLWRRLKKIGFYLPVICDPSAVLSSKIQIGEGCFIGKRAVINTNVLIGKMCIINTGAILEHDCKIGDFSHVSVGSILCGNVQVGRFSFIGANATVIQGKKIGDGCIVGAGTAVRKSVEDKQMALDEKVVKITGGGYKLADKGGHAA